MKKRQRTSHWTRWGKIGERRTGVQPSAMAPTLVTRISDADTVIGTSAVCLHFKLLLSVLINKLCIKALSIVISDHQPRENNITPLGTSESFFLFLFVCLYVCFCFVWGLFVFSVGSNRNLIKL